MTSTGKAASEGPAPAAAVETTGRRAPMALVTGAFLVLVLLIVAVLLVVKVTRGTTTLTPPPVAPAAAGTVRAATGVPRSAFDTVGAPHPAGPLPTVLDRQPSLTIGGRPAVVYVGSEFCPYCAAARWPLVVALGRFGTFTHLGATSSSVLEAFPGIQTFSFDGTSYRSRYLSWSAVEQYGQGLDATAPAGFHLLHRLSPLQQVLLTRYGTGAGGPELPFIDIGNRVVVEGAAIGFSPGTLQGLSVNQIATDLSAPSTAVAQAVLGAANEISAAICATTGGKPGAVCSSPGVRAGAARLGL
ncbi:MAG: DUF929 family protein [Acidimicrobiales bacterium]